MRVTELSATDVEPVVAFLNRQRPPKSGEDPIGVDRLRWFLFDAPARPSDVPGGFLLRQDSGEIVGTVLLVPQRFRHRGTELICVTGGSYYVDEKFRGQGVALFTRLTKLAARYPVAATTCNATSSAIWRQFGGVPIPLSDHEWVRVLRWPAIVEEAAGRRAQFSRSKRMARFWDLTRRRSAPGAASNDAFEPIRGDAAMSLVDDPVTADVVEGVRDRSFLQWRYAEAPRSPAHLLVRRDAAAGQAGRAVVGYVPVRRGYRGQIRSILLSDVMPSLTQGARSKLIRDLVEWCRRRGDDLLALRYQPLERARELKGLGFRRRELPAPTAWLIDRSGGFPAEKWRLTPSDGDTIL